MKDKLDAAQVNLQEAMKDHKLMREEVNKAQAEVEYFKKRYDEMFGSVSSLNKRIEELETHKKHLLDKLKQSVSDYM